MYKVRNFDIQTIDILEANSDYYGFVCEFRLSTNSKAYR